MDANERMHPVFRKALAPWVPTGDAVEDQASELRMEVEDAVKRDWAEASALIDRRGGRKELFSFREKRDLVHALEAWMLELRARIKTWEGPTWDDVRRLAEDDIKRLDVLLKEFDK